MDADELARRALARGFLGADDLRDEVADEGDDGAAPGASLRAAPSRWRPELLAAAALVSAPVVIALAYTVGAARSVGPTEPARTAAGAPDATLDGSPRPADRGPGGASPPAPTPTPVAPSGPSVASDEELLVWLIEPRLVDPVAPFEGDRRLIAGDLAGAIAVYEPLVARPDARPAVIVRLVAALIRAAPPSPPDRVRMIERARRLADRARARDPVAAAGAVALWVAHRDDVAALRRRGPPGVAPRVQMLSGLRHAVLEARRRGVADDPILAAIALRVSGELAQALGDAGRPADGERVLAEAVGEARRVASAGEGASTPGAALLRATLEGLGR